MIIKNWVYYMQRGLQSMWPKKKKEYKTTSNFKECGCLPDCGCKE